MGPLTVMAIVAASELAIKAVSKRLGRSETATRGGFARLAQNVLEAGGQAAATELNQLGEDELAKLLAEGPTEQTRALLPVDVIFPNGPDAHQQVSGFGQVVGPPVPGSGGVGQ